MSEQSQTAPEYGAIDIVVNVFTPREFAEGRIATDDAFRAKTRQADAFHRGIEIPDYIRKMDAAHIDRSLLIAVRMGDLRVRGSVEIPYERVREICHEHPDRFSGLAGIDPTRGVQGCANWMWPSRNTVSSVPTTIPTGSASPPTRP